MLHKKTYANYFYFNYVGNKYKDVKKNTRDDSWPDRSVTKKERKDLIKINENAIFDQIFQCNPKSCQYLC